MGYQRQRRIHLCCLQKLIRWRYLMRQEVKLTLDSDMPWCLPTLKCVLRRQHFSVFGCSLCVTSKYRKRYREQMTPYAFESRSRYFDVIQRSICAAPLQIQRSNGQWFNVPNGSPTSFKTCIKKCNAAVCCSETNSLSLYFRRQNWAKQHCV